MWDGEALHFAINQLAKNLEKGEASAVIEEAANKAVEKYAEKIEIGKEKLVEFLSKFYEFIKEEEIVTIFTEKLIESFSEGLVGTPDIIGIRKDGKVVPVDIKLGYLGRGLKKEHALQIIGESILTERFFRKSVEVAYLIYFESNSLVKIVVRDDMKREFLMYKKGLIKTFRSRYIPPISRLPNFKRRVCQGCHVKHACENIELLKRIY
jgi:CRISPR/Cas system-associated exonuclease Cas4 (RecB family)